MKMPTNRSKIERDGLEYDGGISESDAATCFAFSGVTIATGIPALCCLIKTYGWSFDEKMHDGKITVKALDPNGNKVKGPKATKMNRIQGVGVSLGLISTIFGAINLLYSADKLL